MERQKGSGWLQTAATLENEKSIEEMICSPEDHPGTHVPSKDIAEGLKISQSSVWRMIKIKGIKEFERLKTSYMNDTTRKRIVERAGCLLEKFETNPQVIEHAGFQDENDFPLQIPMNCQNEQSKYK